MEIEEEEKKEIEEREVVELNEVDFGERLVIVVLREWGIGLRLKKGKEVGERNMVIVGMNLGKWKEEMEIEEILKEWRMKRRLEKGEEWEVDIEFKMFIMLRLEIELLNIVEESEDKEGIIRVGGIYKNFVGNYCI